MFSKNKEARNQILCNFIINLTTTVSNSNVNLMLTRFIFMTNVKHIYLWANFLAPSFALKIHTSLLFQKLPDKSNKGSFLFVFICGWIGFSWNYFTHLIVFYCFFIDDVFWFPLHSFFFAFLSACSSCNVSFTGVSTYTELVPYIL